MTETPVTPPEGQKTSTGLEPNTAALLAYLLTWVTGLIFFLIEKENKYVRFHALQAILLGVAIIVIWIIIFIVDIILGYIPILGGIIALLLSLVFWFGSLVVWILMMVKAYQGQMYKLPVIGDIAERNI